MITEADFHMYDDDYMGFCVSCKDFTTDECEPDARKYECHTCGEKKVYGTQEALLMGVIGIK